MEHQEERHMGRIFVYPLALSSLLTVSYTASAVLTEDIATDDLIDRLTRSPSEVALPSLPIDPVEVLISAVNLHSAAGPPGRINGATLVEPQTACFAAPGLGIFADDGPW
jgi:hypothetical protein